MLFKNSILKIAKPYLELLVISHLEKSLDISKSRRICLVVLHLAKYQYITRDLVTRIIILHFEKDQRKIGRGTNVLVKSGGEKRKATMWQIAQILSSCWKKSNKSVGVMNYSTWWRLKDLSRLYSQQILAAL